MKLRLIQFVLVACLFPLASAPADEAKLSKAQELTQAREFVSRLGTAKRLSKRPVVGLLNYWELRIDTFSEDYEKQLERSAIYPIYYECCREMERLYGSKPTTYLAKDSMGYPSQMTIVEFDDVDFGKSHLIAGLWEGNDSTGFYFLHLPGAFDLKEGWKKRESWNLEGIFFDGKKPAEQGVAPQSATRSESDSEDSNKPQPDAKPRPR